MYAYQLSYNVLCRTFMAILQTYSINIVKISRLETKNFKCNLQFGKYLQLSYLNVAKFGSFFRFKKLYIKLVIMPLKWLLGTQVLKNAIYCQCQALYQSYRTSGNYSEYSFLFLCLFLSLCFHDTSKNFFLKYFVDISSTFKNAIKRFSDKFGLKNFKLNHYQIISQSCPH